MSDDLLVVLFWMNLSIITKSKLDDSRELMKALADYRACIAYHQHKYLKANDLESAAYLQILFLEPIDERLGDLRILHPAKTSGINQGGS
jgi:hypothetical protein